MASSACTPAGGAVYGLGLFGAWFYFWQAADAGFWTHAWAIVQGILWPAFLVFDAFTALAR